MRTASGNEDSWAALVARTTSGRADSKSRRATSNSTNVNNKSDDRRILSEDLELGQSPERSTSPLPLLEEELDEERQNSPSLNHDNDSLSSQESDKSYLPPPRSYFHLSPLCKNIIKCVAAYFLAELFTFHPFLSDLLGSPFDLDGPIRNLHIVATVATYFNPAKTNGAMVEADMFMLIGLFYALFICCGSMYMTIWLGEELGFQATAHFIVLVFWLGVGLGIVAWLKVKVNKPSFVTTGSLVSLIVCVIVTKEGAFIAEFPTTTIKQIILLTLVGTGVSNLVCFSLWPVSATARLQDDLDKTMNSFETLLQMLSSTFLDDDDHPASLPDLLAAISTHQATFTTLPISLSQATYEFRYRGSGLIEGYGRAVGGLTRLAQCLTGLRAGCGPVVEGLEAEKDVLGLFRERVASDLRNLTGTASEAFDLMGDSVKPSNLASFDHDDLPSAQLRAMNTRLLVSVKDFEAATTSAIQFLYQNPSSSNPDSDPFSDPPVGDDGVAPNEEIFRIYYWCHNLAFFVREEGKLLETFAGMKEQEEAYKLRGTKAPAPKSSSIFRSLKTVTPFPEMIEGALTSHPTPPAGSFVAQLKFSIWRLGIHLRDPSIRFAIKAGVGAAILATPAFLESTRPTWIVYRGEWALVSYMVVMSPTVGITKTMAVGRLVGTFVGASVAILLYSNYSRQPLLLAFLGALFSIWPFYIILAIPSRAASGRFVLLTFNLTCLYAYNLREEETDIWEIAYHRSIAVAIGVLWSLIVTSYIWPFEARRELRKGLSQFFHNSAYFYRSLIQTYSVVPSKLQSSATCRASETTPLLPDSSVIRTSPDFLEMEVFLQTSLITISALLVVARNEPRLKGTFPPIYRQVLTECQSLLDSLSSMRNLRPGSPGATERITREFVVPVNRERREMVGNVILFLSVLAGAVSLKNPLPPYLPPARLAQERLLAKLQSLPIVKQRIIQDGSESLIYLAYATVMKDIITRLEQLGEMFQGEYGIVGGQTLGDFEANFSPC